MNKTLFIVIIVGVFLAAIGGYVYLGKRGGDSVTESDNNQTTAMDSLRNLMAAGSSLQCTFVDAEANSEGTIKVSGGQMRGDFTVTGEDKSIVSHMITDSEKMYIWSDELPGQGFIYTIPDVQGEEGSPAPSAEFNAPDVDKKLDYKCSPWAVDSSVFTPPSEVKFSDISTMMQGLPVATPAPTNSGEKTESDANAQCAACNSLSGDVKAQCLQALGCN